MADELPTMPSAEELGGGAQQLPVMPGANELSGAPKTDAAQPLPVAPSAAELEKTPTTLTAATAAPGQPSYVDQRSPVPIPARKDMTGEEQMAALRANVGPSIGRVGTGMWDAAKGVWNTLNATPEEAAKGIPNDPVAGIGSLIHSGEVYAGELARPYLGNTAADIIGGTRGQTPEQRQAAIEPGAQFLKSKAEMYTEPGALGQYTPSWGATKRAFINDPAAVGLDFLSIADPALRATGIIKGAKAGEAASVSEASLGQGLHEAVSNSKNAVDSAYKTAYSQPGVFHPLSATEIWNKATGALASDPQFTGWDALDKAKSLANVKDAMGRLYDHFDGLNPNDFTMPRMEMVRRDLAHAAEGASGTEQHMIRSLINGFDNGIETSAGTPGAFRPVQTATGPVGGDGPAAVRAMQQARSEYVRHQAQFGDGAPASIQTAIKSFGKDLSQAGEPEFHAAGTNLGRSLMHPGNGPAAYSHLGKVGVDTPMVNNYLQERMLAGNQAQVAKNLKTPTAQSVFGSEGLNRAQQLNTARNQGSMAGAFAKRGLEAGLSLLGASQHPAGAFLGHYAAKGLEHAMPSAGPGASLYERFSTTPGRGDLLGAVTRAGLRTNAVTTGEQQANRPQHARGGKIGHQHLVDRLVGAVEAAKQAEKTRTSSLLSQPDEHVAKALKTAQAAI